VIMKIRFVRQVACIVEKQELNRIGIGIEK
jgi:hypothetical protein